MKLVCVMRVVFNVIFRLHFVYSVQCRSLSRFLHLSMSRICVARFVLCIYSRDLLAASEVQPCFLFYNVLVVVRGCAN